MNAWRMEDEVWIEWSAWMMKEEWWRRNEEWGIIKKEGVRRTCEEWKMLRMKDEGWRMKNEEWRMKNEEWRIKDEE